MTIEQLMQLYSVILNLITKQSRLVQQQAELLVIAHRVSALSRKIILSPQERSDLRQLRQEINVRSGIFQEFLVHMNSTLSTLVSLTSNVSLIENEQLPEVFTSLSEIANTLVRLMQRQIELLSITYRTAELSSKLLMPERESTELRHLRQEINVRSGIFQELCIHMSSDLSALSLRVNRLIQQEQVFPSLERIDADIYTSETSINSIREILQAQSESYTRNIETASAYLRLDSGVREQTFRGLQPATTSSTAIPEAVSLGSVAGFFSAVGPIPTTSSSLASAPLLSEKPSDAYVL